mgnify:CR=1 FL=1
MADALYESSLKSLPRIGRGKVRDIYDLGDRLLIVATDRISAFDVILPDAIPYKGQVLNQTARFWFEQTRDIVPNHVIGEPDPNVAVESMPIGTTGNPTPATPNTKDDPIASG